MKTDRLRAFLERAQSDSQCEGLDLAAFLLTPIQRLPRYVLLLNNLLKVWLCVSRLYYVSLLFVCLMTAFR